MTEAELEKRYFIDRDNLPAHYPTHIMTDDFWAALGRAVATFGFLEEILGKAIFALTATRVFEDENVLVAEFEKWKSTLERALTDQLGGLVDSFDKAVKARGDELPDCTDLVSNLRAAAKLRNTLCHGSWQKPDEKGRSVPFFVTKNLDICETAMDVQFLNQTQNAAADFACCVMNVVTSLGLQFPGSGGPGKVIGGFR
jgi:hypothetical protein